MSAAKQIMVVEDDESLGFLIQDSLSTHGWAVQLYTTGEKGLTAFHNNTFDLCILDVMLPEKDGFDLAREIRKYNQGIPIVFLSAKNQTEDRIKGFQIGADDYVSKPFSLEEFKYRIEAILKRTGSQTTPADKASVLQIADSALDIHNLLLTAGGIPTRLTYKECSMLQLFFRHPDKVIERDVFLKTIWEDDGFFVARSMDVFVSRLRKYLSHDTALRIENIRAVGYILKRVTAT
ncbi:response regulator transcription factor [Dawidia soli]|uniref:Response regulator transcription factor n=1 Tax=Dawidia soli TaxID=2782352 RepID=A0AAP2GL73_9BACT|nr:response regulator transcription factor [Dawidia soli]MBT1690305.1 response regulator transcription factor [Dawidia soli]